ncbi:MAG: DNA adenine methylase, partial [Candidatus Heimdallarchaeota archaeon]
MKEKEQNGSNVILGLIKFIRYPGGKQRLLTHLDYYLPNSAEIQGTYIEPFVGGGSVFFSINPKKAILSDINEELIDLFRGIRYAPRKIWKIYTSFPSTKEGYYAIRDEFNCKGLIPKAARILFLNRTCFKGMWRHNSQGKFNIGYGGQDRRWVINEDDIIEVSKRLKGVKLYCTDFQKIIDNSQKGDFLFLDPPYKPNKMMCSNEHYSHGFFSFDDHI